MLIREMESIPGKLISLHDGAYLFREGAPAHYFYIVRSGHIFIMKYGASGRVLSLRLATTGSLIGELPLYEETPTYISSVRLHAVRRRCMRSSFRCFRHISRSIRISPLHSSS